MSVRMIPKDNPARVRIENKFVAGSHSYSLILERIRFHPAHFVEIFHERTVNNIYFDTVDFANFFENAAGTPIRFKTRIRWYGECLREILQPVLEFKIKRGWAGSKELFPLAGFIRGGGRRLDVPDYVRGSRLPARARERLAFMRPVLLNRYRRRYFLASDGQCRLTVDHALDFRLPDDAAGAPDVPGYPDASPLCVIELKYPPAARASADAISNCFPFRLTRFSKYVAGVERLYG